MKKLLLLFLLSINYHVVTSQNILDVEFGSIFKNEKREIPVDIIGKDENGYYLLYSEGKYGQGDDMFLRKFNLDLTPSDQEINLKSDTYEGKFNSLGLIKIKNKIVHVFYLLTENGKTFYYQNIELDTFLLSPKKEITTVLNDSKNANNSISKFMISDDENTITLFYTIPNRNNETAKIRIQTFDSGFNEKTSNYFNFPYNNDVLSYRSVFVNSKNELFIVCKKYDSYKILNDENNHRYEFQIYNIKSDQLGLLATIRPENVHLRSLNTTIINDNELALTGLYSEKDLYAMNGVYAAKIDLTNGNILTSKYNKFTSDFFAKLMDDGKKKKKAIAKYKEGKRADQNYILRQTLKLDNDELLVLAEQIWSYSYNYSITYYHHDIAVIKLNKDGEIIWTNKIGKRNDKPNVSIYNSYHPIYKNNQLFLLYNCSAKNLNHTTGLLANYFTDYDKAFISANVDLNSGDYKRQLLIRNDQLEGITIRPSLYNWVDDNTLLMFGQDIDNLKNQRFVKIKVK
ncbi:hypothetical protein [Algibacter sp.]|uniref:hypothetical protein n=1 Tax=Algibacter sp. TaxID=1872428 RepID=UPI003C75B944